MRRGKLAEIKRNLSCYGLLLPSLLLVSVFCVVPFIWAFTTSFYRYEIGGDATWVGLSNYLEYVQDPTFAISFGNLLFLSVFRVFVLVVFPLIIARLIFAISSERLRYAYRIVFLVPIVVPAVAMLMIWQGLIYSDNGLLNETLRELGNEELTVGWLSNPDTVLWAVAFIGFPFAHGINVLIYYAGLTAIPESVHEAAALDGATGLGKFFRIDLPLVLSQVKLLVILTIIAAVQGFQQMFILTRGGPGFSSMVPGLWMYFNAFSFQRMGYACAIGVILFLMILVLTILNLKYFRSAEDVKAAG